MLDHVAEGVLVHKSEFVQSNAIVVEGDTGLLLIDPGVYESEIDCLASDLAALGRPVVVGFSTHPHWDHLLWHAKLGTAPRYGTATCAGAARKDLPDGTDKLAKAAGIPDHVPLEHLGLIEALPPGTARIPWDGPRVRLLEHRAHAQGHAALLVEEAGVLVAGDMLSDVLIPMLDVHSDTDPIDDYLDALEIFEREAGGVDVVVPGHGSVGGAEELHTRIEQDRIYVSALRDSDGLDDPRFTAAYSRDWLPSVHERQVQGLAERRGHR